MLKIPQMKQGAITVLPSQWVYQLWPAPRCGWKWCITQLATWDLHMLQYSLMGDSVGEEPRKTAFEQALVLNILTI